MSSCCAVLPAWRPRPSSCVLVAWLACSPVHARIGRRTIPSSEPLLKPPPPVGLFGCLQAALPAVLWLQQRCRAVPPPSLRASFPPSLRASFPPCLRPPLCPFLPLADWSRTVPCRASLPLVDWCGTCDGAEATGVACVWAHAPRAHHHVGVPVARRGPQDHHNGENAIP